MQYFCTKSCLSAASANAISSMRFAAETTRDRWCRCPGRRSRYQHEMRVNLRQQGCRIIAASTAKRRCTTLFSLPINPWVITKPSLRRGAAAARPVPPARLHLALHDQMVVGTHHFTYIKPLCLNIAFGRISTNSRVDISSPWLTSSSSGPETLPAPPLLPER